MNPGTKKFPQITECTITINECRYRLSGIVYLKSSHFWCEVYSCQRNYKKGWTCTMASGIMEKPLLLVLILCSEEKKETLYLLMFEQLRSELNSLDILNYLYRPLSASNTDIIKLIVSQHKNQLSLVCFVPDSEMPHISVHTACEKYHEELEKMKNLTVKKICTYFFCQ